MAGSVGSRDRGSLLSSVSIPSKFAVKFKKGFIFITFSSYFVLVFRGFVSTGSFIASPLSVSSTVPVISTPGLEFSISPSENVFSDFLLGYFLGTVKSGAWTNGGFVEIVCVLFRRTVELIGSDGFSKSKETEMSSFVRYKKIKHFQVQKNNIIFTKC